MKIQNLHEASYAVSYKNLNSATKEWLKEEKWAKLTNKEKRISFSFQELFNQARERLNELRAECSENDCDFYWDAQEEEVWEYLYDRWDNKKEFDALKNDLNAIITLIVYA